MGEKLLYYADATCVYEAEGANLSEEMENIIRRWAPRYGEFEFDLLELGALEDPTLIILEDEEGNQSAYLYGIWGAGARGIVEMLGLSPILSPYNEPVPKGSSHFEEAVKKIEKMTPEELKEFLAKERYMYKEDIKVIGEGDEKIIEYPVVFILEPPNGELGEWVYEGKEALDFVNKACKLAGKI